MLMCSQAWICCFCLVNFSRKREKAICARRGLGETASKTRKADGQAPVFLYINILLHLLCSRCLVSLNPQLVWAQVSGAWWCTRLEGISAGSCSSLLILTSTDSHKHHSASCKETLVWLLCPQAPPNIFAPPTSSLQKALSAAVADMKIQLTFPFSLINVL